MEKKVMQKPVIETKEVIKPVDVFVAKDGKEFDTEAKCLAHEERLEKIEKGKSLFIPMSELTDTQESAILKLCFGAYNTLDDIKILIWKVSPEKEQGVLDYLRYMYFNSVYDNIFNDFKEGEYVVIASWTEDYHTDRPSYEGKCILLNSIISELDKLKELIKVN
jgi:hypothetical protein